MCNLIQKEGLCMLEAPACAATRPTRRTADAVAGARFPMACEQLENGPNEWIQLFRRKWNVIFTSQSCPLSLRSEQHLPPTVHASVLFDNPGNEASGVTTYAQEVLSVLCYGGAIQGVYGSSEQSGGSLCEEAAVNATERSLEFHRHTATPTSRKSLPICLQHWPPPNARSYSYLGLPQISSSTSYDTHLLLSKVENTLSSDNPFPWARLANMALSPLLYDTYRRYKAGTKKIVQWLASTARETGTVDDIFLRVGKGPTGKSRSKEDPQVPVHTLSPKALLRLADAVVTKGITIPHPILAILQDVIDSRKEFLERLKSGRREKDAKGNAPVPEDKDTEQSRLSNLFEYLNVEELLDSDADSPQSSQPVSSQPVSSKPLKVPPRPSVTYEMEKSEDDTVFAIFCYFKDVTDVRLFIRRTWILFKQGQLTLETAALTMSSGIGLIKRLYDDFVKRYPRFETHVEIWAYLTDGYFNPDKTNASPAFIAYAADGQELSYMTVSCEPVITLIHMFVLQKQDITDYDLTPDEILLVNCLLQMKDLALSGDDTYRARDPVQKAMRSILMENKTPSWAVFAIQVFWDTQRELAKNFKDVLINARNTASWVRESMEELIAWEEDGGHGTRNATRRSELLRFASLVKSKQEIFDSRIGQLSKNGAVPEDMFAHHPMLSGITTQELIALHQVVAFEQIPIHGVIMGSAHLYNAVAQAGLLPRGVVWKDMDWVIQNQGEAHMYVGRRPRLEKEKDFTIHYGLVMGFSLTQLLKSKDTRDPTWLLPRDDGYMKPRLPNRKLKYPSIFLKVSTTARDDGKGSTYSSATLVDTVLLDRIVQEHIEDTVKNNHTKKTKICRTSTLSPVAMLTLLRDTLQKDEFPLRFNTPELYMGCVKMLRRIRQLVVTKAPHDYREDTCVRGEGIEMCVFGLATELDGRPLIDEPQLPEAARILREFIEEEGEEVCQKTIARTPQRTGNTKASTEKEASFESPATDYISPPVRKLFFDSFGLNDIHELQLFLRDKSWV
ncbi:uncharacterized protein EI97DRAFT_444418 [Westerdykella ornata]|uniref:DUF6604 domain-containing protein n=1 Tax=Westerdykella ornata TaxID=318751 RepID=A0A6A6JDR8_WESOR|nr:uncharacterized protein EI97DRAFT_444418 [Westerdykella ornata]KAF2274138.1 hypothetical protein EI97DRAFT_444418 [Westerdykella ornata]